MAAKKAEKMSIGEIVRERCPGRLILGENIGLPVAQWRPHRPKKNQCCVLSIYYL